MTDADEVGVDVLQPGPPSLDVIQQVFVERIAGGGVDEMKRIVVQDNLT